MSRANRHRRRKHVPKSPRRPVHLNKPGIKVNAIVASRRHVVAVVRTLFVILTILTTLVTAWSIYRHPIDVTVAHSVKVTDPTSAIFSLTNESELPLTDLQISRDGPTLAINTAKTHGIIANNTMTDPQQNVRLSKDYLDGGDKETFSYPDPFKLPFPISSGTWIIEVKYKSVGIFQHIKRFRFVLYSDADGNAEWERQGEA